MLSFKHQGIKQPITEIKSPNYQI